MDPVAYFAGLCTPAALYLVLTIVSLVSLLGFVENPKRLLESALHSNRTSELRRGLRDVTWSFALRPRSIRSRKLASLAEGS